MDIIRPLVVAPFSPGSAVRRNRLASNRCGHWGRISGFDFIEIHPARPHVSGEGFSDPPFLSFGVERHLRRHYSLKKAKRPVTGRDRILAVSSIGPQFLKCRSIVVRGAQRREIGAIGCGAVDEGGRFRCNLATRSTVTAGLRYLG